MEISSEKRNRVKAGRIEEKIKSGRRAAQRGRKKPRHIG
jgi:hypothetical protein